MTGTSASAAEVSAAAALLRAADPSASNGVIVGRLARNADAAGTADQTGNGRLNLARAIGGYVDGLGQAGRRGAGGEWRAARRAVRGGSKQFHRYACHADRGCGQY